MPPVPEKPLGRFVAAMPFGVLLIWIAALAMALPAAVATTQGDTAVARSFVGAALLACIAALLLALARNDPQRRVDSRRQLLSLVVAYVTLPVLLAVPFWDSVGTTSYLDAWFEMVSAFTTTGATLYDPANLSPAEHLWRALVGWLGGFLIWVGAIAILAPLNLGGYEVTSEAKLGQMTRVSAAMQVATPAFRLRRYAGRLLPIYMGLTGALWVILLSTGETPLVAACHAMSTLATSGISPVDGMEGRPGGVLAEVAIFAFLLFAVSRNTFVASSTAEGWRRLRSDRELAIAVAVVCALTLVLFLRHWLAALEGPATEEAVRAAAAVWGTVFTTLSFLTTTGFVSEAWGAARAWSGLPTPGLILVGLAIMGGGVATTAGGVKLLRVYVLYKHGVREMEKLLHPNSIGGAGRLGRRIRREGAVIAWIFFMLFMLALALVASALALTGLGFEPAMVFAVAGLTTTGPLANATLGIGYAALEPAAKVVLAAAMIVGRLETLVIVALLNPGFWRR